VTLGSLVGMLALGTLEGFNRGRAQRRLSKRLALLEHEIAILKSCAYDRVASVVEATHREVSTWAKGEAQRQEHLRAQLAAPQTAMQARVPSDGGGEREFSQPAAAEREAAGAKRSPRPGVRLEQSAAEGGVKTGGVEGSNGSGVPN